MPATTRWGDVGLKVGLEIHQQLATPKLFCSCPSDLDEPVDVTFHRVLTPTASELGEVDPAAVAEALKNLSFTYQGSHATSCLVEMDEEPPHDMTRDALDVALEVALLLDMTPVDEVHVMRKIVIDGSNTSGFQRTSLVATGGGVDATAGRVGIDTLCLEEDASRRMGEKGGRVAFRLDRLGIPLVEIATAPDIRTPEAAREVAEAIGLALRSTGRVKRGLGTIRQDLNVSIRDGARVEVKGVQELRILPLAVEAEVARQQHLLAVRDRLRARGVDTERLDGAVVDVTRVFEGTDSKVITGALKRGGRILALPLPGYAGLLKAFDEGGPRLGRELADHAKVAAGVKGLFHSDELPAYGITDGDVAAVRDALGVDGDDDAFALVAAPEDVARRALDAVRERAKAALTGVPEETRDALEDGTTRYLRPLPGGARMYPETDVPPTRLPRERVDAMRGSLPELLTEKAARLAGTYDLAAQDARAIAFGPHAALFEALAAEGQAREAARVIVHVLPETGDVPEEALREVFAKLKAGAFTKEALPDVLAAVAGGRTVPDAVDAVGGALDLGDLEAEVDKVLDENAALIAERGEHAVKPLMGTLMGKLRGRVPAKDLAALLQRKVRERTG